MRISESRLRSVINNVINEMSGMLPHSSVSNDIIESMADACCRMSSADIFKMCSQIFVAAQQNKQDQESMAKHCAELCACSVSGDDIGCCRCLKEICSYPECYEICKTCCKC